jgi:hypothetical protein
MASVYDARLRAPGGASKQVALKLIHPHLSREPQFVGLFLNEMRVAMALSHRNIVQTFDAGKHGERYYLVMELMDGGSLARLLRSRAGAGALLPLDIVLFVATEVCAALEYAHAFRPEGGGPGGVLHRDVSPGNILLTAQGDVKLADFGVAKAAGRISSSIGGMIKGKLAYMAPEQARGQVGPASDLFSLGAVLYGMVAGAPLRESPSLDEVRQGVGKVTIPRGCRPEVSRSLEQLIAQCLSTAPARRPGSAAVLRERLAEEQEWVRRRQSPGRGPHARLREYLGAAPAPTRGQARLMADAIRQAALEVPTQVGRPPPEALTPQPARTPSVPVPAVEEAPPLSPAETLVSDTVVEPEVAPPARVEVTAPVRPPPARLRDRGGRPLVAVVVAVALAAVGGVLVWWALRAPPPPPKLVTGDPIVDAAPTSEVTPDARPPSPDGGRASPDTGRAAAAASDASVESPPLSATQPPRRRRPGTLDLNASPWAKVYLGRRYLGETPLQGISLPAGRYQLRLVNPQRRLSTRITVHIRSGRTTRRSVRLGIVTP